MKKILSISFIIISFFLQAQEAKKKKDKILPKANQEFAAQNYTEAEAKYRISNSKDLSGAKPAYNLGNAIYRQEHTGEAKFAYMKAIEKATSRTEKHRAFHNLGNVFMKEKQYTKAVEAYKNALRNNPADEETRYNYALAKEYLKNNPEEPDNDKGDQDKDKNEDKKDKEGNEKEDKKGEGDKEKDNKDQSDGKQEQNKSQQEGQPQPSGITKEQLKNLLEAVNNEEKKVQDKVNQEKIKGRPVPAEKDW